MTDSPRLEAERLAKSLGKAIRVAVDGKLSFASVDVDELARLAVAYSGVVTSTQGGQELNRLLLALLVASADKSTQRAITLAQHMKTMGFGDETRDEGSRLIARNALLRDATEKSRRAYFGNP